MRTRLRLFLADSRHRPGRVVGVIVTCVTTAVVVGASALLLADLLAWQPVSESHFGRASAVVVTRLADGTRGGVIPAPTTDALTSLDHVGRVVEYHDRWLSVHDGETVVTGRDERPTRAWNWSAADALGYHLTGSTGPQGTDIVIDTRIAERLSAGVGDQITTVSAAGRHDRRVAGIVTTPSGTEPVLLLSDAELARQPGNPAPQALLAFAAPRSSADAVRDSLTQRLDGERFEIIPPGRYWPGPADSALDQVTGGLDLFSLLLFVLLSSAAVVLGTTLSLWTSQRLPHLTVLRALGVSAVRIRLLVLADVLRLAVPSALVGAALGAPLVAGVARAPLVDNGLLPAGIPQPGGSLRTVLIVLAVVAATVVMSLVAAVSAVLAAGRVDPGSVLRAPGTPAGLRRRLPRLIGGLSLLVTGLIPLVVTIGSGPMFVGAAATGAAIIIVPALTLLSPWLVPALTPLASAFLRLDPRIGLVAGANLRASPVRAAALAGPALLGVGLTTVFLGAPRTIDTAVTEQSGDRVIAEHAVLADGTGALPLTWRDSQSAGTSASIVGCVVVPPKDPYGDVTTPVEAAGVDPATIASVLDLDLRDGDLAQLTGETFAAGVSAMSEHDWSLGQRVRLQMSDGEWHSLRLVASYRRDLGFAGVLLPRELAVRHHPDPGAGVVFVNGPVPERLQPGEHARDRAGFLSRQQVRSGADNLATLLIALAIAGYALLSLANTAALGQADRGTERRTIRMIGAGRRQLARLIIAEALGAITIGVLLGFAVAMIGLVPLSLAVGHGPLPVFDPLWTLAVPLMCALTGVVPALLAGRPFRRVDHLAEDG